MATLTRPMATLAVAVLLLAASTADAVLSTGACLVQKRKAWITFRKCQAAEQVKQIKGKPADLAKCDPVLQAMLAKITVKALKAAIACRYRDNGDGTITDYDTAIQWERKTGGLPSEILPLGFCIVDDVHCVNSTYTWVDANDFISRLNGTTSDASTLAAPFAGHSDWRLPSIVELKGIKDPSAPDCGAGPPCVIASISGPTKPGYYWSSSVLPSGGTNAWDLDFGRSGGLDYENKATPNYVRAARFAL